MNNLLGVLLRRREEQVALVGDIRKMFNSVYLKPLDRHCHRFLWRSLKTDEAPGVYVMTRVSMGDTLAPAISTEAIYKTADMFESDSPNAATPLKRSSYVDDSIDSEPNKSEALEVARETENVLVKGGFAVECWQFSQESGTHTGSELRGENDKVTTPSGSVHMHTNMKKGTRDTLRVLGVGWNPVQDTVVFEVTLNFSKKRKGVHTGPNLEKADVPQALPLVLTKRIVLGQVMMIYVPLGSVLPFTKNLPARNVVSEAWLG